MIKFSCKNCGQSISVDGKYSGKRAKCPKCHSVIVIPGNSDEISFQCENCGQKIKVPKSYAGKKGKCPKCSNVVIVPASEPIPAEPEVPGAPFPPDTDEDLYDEQSEEYEESEGMDRRLIFIISGVAAVVVVGIIILAVVLRSSGSSPVERYGIQDNQQQVVNRNLQPQPATADTQPSELKAQELSREGIPSNEIVQPQGNIENTKILFRSNRDGVTEIYVMNPDGTGQLNITQNRSGGEIWPSWSPDGRQIAFCGHDLDVFVMNADGSEPVNLTNNSRGQWDSTENRNPSWSRSGGKLAFVSKIKGRYEICVVNRDGSELRNLTDHPEGSRAGALMRPSWSPDGRIVFSSNRDSMIKGNDHEDIYVMNADGTERQRLTDHNAQDYLPSWSPNGDKIAFVSKRDGTSALYVMNSDGSNQKMLTKTRSPSYPIWSPDGKKIAFRSYIDRNLEIYIINADGSGLKRLTNHPGNDEACVWSPDGKNILFQSDRDGNLEIYMIGADGNGLRNLTNNPANDDSPMWSPFQAPEVVDRDSRPQQITSDSNQNETAEPLTDQEADVISTAQSSGYIDYVAELNKLGIAGRSESDNAAPLYQKVIELYVEVSPELEVLVSTEWPAELSADEQRLLRQWVQSNSEALSQLEFAANKPYYWYQLSSPDIDDPSYLEGSVITVLLPDLSYYRKLSQALLLRAKLSAAEGNFDQAITDIVTCYRVGLHLHTGGPKMLVEQLVGIYVRRLATRTAFAILDRTQLNENSLEGLQSQISQLSTNESYIFDFRSEKFSLLDIIQRIFTNDGNGDGQIDVTVALPILRDAMSLSASVTSVNLDDEASSLQELRRRQTIETVEKSYQHIDTLFLKSQWQLNTENADWTKVAKENFIVATFFPSVDRVSQMRDQCRVGTKALITTLAVLRYEADKGQLPEKIEDLVTSSYLQTLPSDPFSDKTLTYKRTDSGGFILYSFGRNLQDEGGEVGLSRSDGDAVFWPVRTGYYAF